MEYITYTFIFHSFEYSKTFSALYFAITKLRVANHSCDSVIECKKLFLFSNCSLVPLHPPLCVLLSHFYQLVITLNFYEINFFTSLHKWEQAVIVSLFLLELLLYNIWNKSLMVSPWIWPFLGSYILILGFLSPSDWEWKNIF